MQQQLRHDRVIVVLLGQMAVGAGLGLRLAYRVREMWRKGLARKSTGGDGWLRNVDALAVDVLRRQYQCRRRADRRNSFVFNAAMNTNLEHLVAHHLWVVGGVVAGLTSLIVNSVGLAVGLDR